MTKKPIVISLLIIAVSISVSFAVESYWLFLSGFATGAAAFFMFTYLVGKPMLEAQQRALMEREETLNKFRNDILEDHFNSISTPEENPN